MKNTKFRCFLGFSESCGSQKCHFSTLCHYCTPLEEVTPGLSSFLMKFPYHIHGYADNIQRQAEFQSDMDDWIYMGTVIDHFLVVVFAIGLAIGHAWIFWDYFNVDWFK